MGLASNDKYLPKCYTLAPNCGKDLISIGLSAISSDFHQNPECEEEKIIQIF